MGSRALDQRGRGRDAPRGAERFGGEDGDLGGYGASGGYDAFGGWQEALLAGGRGRRVSSGNLGALHGAKNMGYEGGGIGVERRFTKPGPTSGQRLIRMTHPPTHPPPPPT